MPAVTPVLANVADIVAFAEPSNPADPDKSPATANVLEVANAVAVLALPVKAPTNVVDVTEVKPANVVDVAPNDMLVDPTVTALFAKLALLIAAEPLRLLFVKPLIVLLPATMVLFVNVCVSVAPTIV